MLADWAFFPAIFFALATGCGLLLDVVAGARLSRVLLVPAGFAAMTVIAQLFAVRGFTAPLATPATVAFSLLGFALGGGRLKGTYSPWLVVAPILVFGVYAAPVVLSGEATFAGYIRLDDTATWLAIVDHVIHHGRDLGGLPASTYEATLATNLSGGYPIGAFLPLGVARAISGQDVAWIFQPYLACLAAILSLSLCTLAGTLIRRPRLIALTAFVAAQPALLYGYAMWGGVKELAAAALVALLAATLAIRRKGSQDPRPLIVPAVACAALLSVLGLGGLAWVAPLLLVPVAGLVRGGSANRRTILTGFAVAALISIPFLGPGMVHFVTSGSLISSGTVGNLGHHLSPLQVFGVWPTGDFKVAPSSTLATGVLLAAVAAGAAIGGQVAWRAADRSLLLYAGGALASCAVIVLLASPWIGAKALATASPAVLTLAVAGAVLHGLGPRRIEGTLLVLAIAGGVLWSNALAFREVDLAPRPQLAELEAIGHRLGSADGPTLMTEFQPYGVRHFLRAAAPEGASELRRRLIQKLDGTRVAKGQWVDTDQLMLAQLLQYRTLVIRGSPLQSRPPSAYRLVSTGRFYEVWRRDDAVRIQKHLPLGSSGPAGVAGCAAIRRLVRGAAPGDELVAAPAPEVVSATVSRPATARERSATVRIDKAATYDLWLGGSVRARTRLYVDGGSVGAARNQLNNMGMFVGFGRIRLNRGSVKLMLRSDGPSLVPGSAPSEATLTPAGPIVARSVPEYPGLVRKSPAEASSLCGRRLDWVELVGR